jgi:hypothetical protein
VLLSAIFALLQAAAPSAAISGTIRDDTAGRALPGVQVAEGGALAATTDSLGRYFVSGLAAGIHQLRFTFPGYAPLELRVLLADSSSETRVDVQLAAVPVHLPTLQVVAAAGAAPGTVGDAEIGRVMLKEDWLDHRQAGEIDAQRALADVPGVQGSGENVAGLHVRGGGSSENLVLLDGIPLFSAVHYSGTSSAVNPDAIAGAELHTGVSLARFGEHLAGVVELETREPGPSPFEARGSLGTEDVRQSVSAYLPGIRTGIVVGARTTYRDALMGEGYGGRGNGYQDLLGVATTRAGGGRLRVLSFLADNRLDFPSVSDMGDGGADSGVRSLPAVGEEYPGVSRNAISWSSHSQGVTWSRTDRRGAKLETAAWWAGSSAEVSWLTPSGADQLRSELSEVGLSARTAWPDEDGGLSVGASLVRPRTRYAVRSGSESSTALSPSLSLDAAPTVGSAFAERLWRPSRALLLSAGLRASTDFATWAGLEPRLTAVLEPDGRTRLGIGIGRSHQVMQSAINDASALGSLLGFDLPVAAGSGSLPVARADQLEALAERRLGAGLDLSVTGYVRRTSGLALGAASTQGLFPGDSIVVGQGYASGVTGALDLARGRFSGRASLTTGRNWRTAGATRYDASYGHGTSVRVDLGYRFLEDTRLLARYWGGARQPTSIVAPGFEWRPLQPLGDAGELDGTPENLPGAVNGTQLPGYARFDLGVRRSWRLPGFGNAAILTTALSVANVLGRENALGLVARPDGGLRVIRGVARALALEVGWRF